MPSWNELLTAFEAAPDKNQWLKTETQAALQRISNLRGNRNVLFYGTAFLQKPQAPAERLSITSEDINALMSVMYGMNWGNGLTLVLHTPGGEINATESIVAYLRSKFDDIEVVIPTFAMSAGTMISLAADRIVMGRQSQLGPIDPQMVISGRAASARAVVDQFDKARTEILANTTAAHLWAPILQTIGPASLQAAENALAYSERMVAQWLAKYMFKATPDPKQLGEAVAKHFNDATNHKSHGRRIDRAEARAQQVVVEDLETNQDLQDAVLSAYHLFTIGVEQSRTTKVLVSDAGRMFVKNWSE